MASVVIAVFDGLQPSQVTSELMPNLAALAAEGVSFRNHHPVFPTVTRVNVASMMTGRSPGGHGLAGNTVVMRDFHPYRSFSALEPTLAEVAKKTGRVLLAPTLADILSHHGQEYIAVGVGTTGNAYMQNPNADRSTQHRQRYQQAHRDARALQGYAHEYKPRYGDQCFVVHDAEQTIRQARQQRFVEAAAKHACTRKQQRSPAQRKGNRKSREQNHDNREKKQCGYPLHVSGASGSERFVTAAQSPASQRRPA